MHNWYIFNQVGRYCLGKIIIYNLVWRGCVVVVNDAVYKLGKKVLVSFLKCSEERAELV